MRRTEDEAVAAIMRRDREAAQALLRELLIFDRRRAWWTLFRAAAAIQSDDRRAAMIALVFRTYVARRTGRMVGVPDESVISKLADWLCFLDGDRAVAGLTDEERFLLVRWLPARVSRELAEPTHIMRLSERATTPDNAGHTPPSGCCPTSQVGERHV